MKKYCCFMLAVWLALGPALLAAAQESLIRVAGKVVDEQDKPVAGATVEFVGLSKGSHFSMKTGNDGSFVRMGVTSDVYNITVTKDGQQIGKRAGYELGYSSKPEPLIIKTSKPVSAASRPAVTIALTPPQKQALEELQKLAASAPKKDEAKIKEKLQQAQADLTAGDFEKAIPTLTEITAMDPMNHTAWAQLGFCYAKAGKYDLAVADLEKAVAINPGAGGYHENLAIAYARTGKTDAALVELNSANQADPANAARHYFYSGLLLSDEKKDGPAVEAFDKAIAADPKMADAYYFKGMALMDQAQQAGGKLTAPPGTAEAFKKYLELEPNGPRAAAAKAQLSRLGR